MKIQKMKATGVHGFLSIDISFNNDLTFLIGLNGCGKTTALRLMMALLTPNVEEFVEIEFESSEVWIETDSGLVLIQAKKKDGLLSLAASTVAEPLELSAAELQILASHKREDGKLPLHDKLASSAVFQAIKNMSTPMFLGLDRRFSVPSMPWEDNIAARQREYYARRAYAEEPGLRKAASAGLLDVNYLVTTRTRQILMDQETLDEKFRRKLLTRSFEYKPSEVSRIEQMPSRKELESYRDRLSRIESAAEALQVPLPEVKAALSNFFERMSSVVDVLEQNAKIKRARDKGGKDTKVREAINHDKIMQMHVEWIINKPQADRILENLQLLDSFGEDRTALRKPIEKFVKLINSFLLQTGKELEVGSTGELALSIQGREGSKNITALSSGERQLLVMIAHLSLNTSLESSGVFIVDEPELSLHIDWQERFVEAIREANPSVQIIMATHSPAIILDRDESCVSMSV
ncbi:AAA family ATPase [Pseudomonas alliivorans]|nr:AAA family ATPase [Pseudomonas alliivorans]